MLGISSSKRFDPRMIAIAESDVTLRSLENSKIYDCKTVSPTGKKVPPIRAFNALTLMEIRMATSNNQDPLVLPYWGEWRCDRNLLIAITPRHSFLTLASILGLGKVIEGKGTLKKASHDILFTGNEFI